LNWSAVICCAASFSMSFALTTCRYCLPLLLNTSFELRVFIVLANAAWELQSIWKQNGRFSGRSAPKAYCEGISCWFSRSQLAITLR
jgi:hypothetical protein